MSKTQSSGHHTRATESNWMPNTRNREESEAFGGDVVCGTRQWNLWRLARRRRTPCFLGTRSVNGEEFLGIFPKKPDSVASRRVREMDEAWCSISHRKGHDVRVVESKETVEGFGDFVGIGDSATRQFGKWLGMSAIYEEICYKPIMSLYKYNGELLGGPFPAIGAAHMPTPVSRPKLHRALYDYVCSLGIPVAFGKRVVDYYETMETSKAGVITEAGERIEADLVVAADGVGSKSWKLISGAEAEPKSSGFAVYRTAFSTKIAHEDPFVAEAFPVRKNNDDDVRMYLGPNTHAITLISKDLTTWLLTHLDKGTTASESWSTRLDAEDVLRELEKEPGWDKSLLALIKQTPKQSVVDWKLMWRNPTPQWTSFGGLVIQLFQRVSCAQRTGFKNRELWHHTDFDAAKQHPEKLTEMTGRWITNHDPEEYTYKNWNRCVNHLVSGAKFENTNIPPGYTYEAWTIDELLRATDAGRTLTDERDWS